MVRRAGLGRLGRQRSPRRPGNKGGESVCDRHNLFGCPMLFSPRFLTSQLSVPPSGCITELDQRRHRALSGAATGSAHDPAPSLPAALDHRVRLLHGLPEAIALLKAVVCGQSLPEAMLFSQLLRLSWLSAEVIHGTGHTLLRALLDRDAAALCLANVLEHRSPAQLAQGLLPLAPIGPITGGDAAGAWLDAGDRQPWKLRLKAAGGILLHLLVVLATGSALFSLARAGQTHTWIWELLGAVLFCNLGLILCSRSDHQMMVSGQGSLLHCGNFGLIAAHEMPRSGDLLSARAIRIFQQMGRETELRGAQAGGGLLIALDHRGDNGFVGHRIVNAKRGDLTPSLEHGFRRQRRRARRRGWTGHPGGLLACWHYRFGTSGPPAVRETHWQEWTPGRQGHLWQRDADGRWTNRRCRVHHRITHNGDFEAFEGWGQLVDVAAALGPWLEQALQRPAPAVVDSARIAGMMDLLICQGDWFAAVRWGFLSTVASFPDAPAAADLERWTLQFERVFRELVAGASNPEQLEPLLIERLLGPLQADPALRTLEASSLRRWIQRSLALFLHNDPATAVQQFMQGARGSFGLVVASTTWPDRLVLSSLGQPITIGMDPRGGLALYASESAAVDAVLQGQPEAWRLDLDENAGEVAVLASDALEVTSLSLERPLTAQELQGRRQIYAAAAVDRGSARSTAELRPYRTLPARDPVAADIAALPGLLATIHDDWSNPGSSNRQCAEALGQLLITKAANLAAKESLLRQAGLADSLARSNHVDLLITGVENSLWLGEQFTRDLTGLMPRLNVKVLSSNAVLRGLQNDIDSLQLARQSIVLVLSHSGRTFPSRQVMEACDLMVRRGVIREFFILSGEPDSLQGAAMLKAAPGEAFSRRLFSTGAGRRRAEPATASVVAMHQTLTELLFCLCRQLLQAFPDERTRPLGLRLGRRQLQWLEERESEALLRDCGEIVGADAGGQARPTASSRQLVRAGRHWAQHVLETPLAWAIHALYILVSLELGLPLVQALLRRLLGDELWSAATLQADVLQQAALMADIGVYVFGPWLWTLALRWLQRRPLLARTGRRSLVIGEAAWIHPLLTNYISKLFALSFGIASLEVQGAEVGDHLLHTHAHRLVRGSLLFFGVPDGRGSGLQRADAEAALLTARQADGIRHWNTGPEIVALGTDPGLRAGPFQRALLLPCGTEPGGGGNTAEDQLLESLRESRYGSFRRLLASYVLFWAMARQVALLPALQFKWWRSQSRTRVMTTAAPVSAASLDLAEEQEIAALALDQAAREQS
jgi:hypothetical protein